MEQRVVAKVHLETGDVVDTVLNTAGAAAIDTDAVFLNIVAAIPSPLGADFVAARLRGRDGPVAGRSAHDTTVIGLVDVEAGGAHLGDCGQEGQKGKGELHDCEEVLACRLRLGGWRLG